MWVRQHRHRRLGANHEEEPVRSDRLTAKYAIRLQLKYGETTSSRRIIELVFKNRV